MLTDDQEARLTTMLENLETVLSELNERAQDFVQQTINRHETYGQRVLLSDKQWQWLESLHNQYCKTAPPLPELDHPDKATTTVRGKSNQDDMDDEIPF